MRKNTSSTGDQSIQTGQYIFPYHYIPDVDNSVFLARHWAFASSYVAALELVAAQLKPVAMEAGFEWEHLDIGCGDGALLYHLPRFPGLDGGSISGVDIDSRAVAWARLFNPASEVHIGSLSDLDRKYDSVSLVEVLEHIPPNEVADFLMQAANLLKPKGLLVATVPSVEKLVAPKHYQHFSMSQVRKLLSHRFDAVTVTGFERRDLLTRAVNFLRANNIIRLDAPLLNKVAVKRLGQVYREQAGCGRLFIVARAKD